MRLYLCGGGSGKQIEFALNNFSKSLDKNKPILYIPLAMNEDSYDSCESWFSCEINFFKVKKYEIVKSSYELSCKNFSDYSALFIGGGNTYKLLKDLKDNNNFNKIRDYLDNGGIIFGGSAGAIIFGKSIDSCLNDDGNIVNLNNTSGFNYLNDYSIICHLNNSNLKKNKKYLINFSKKNKVIYLPEEDVIVISDDKLEFIGSKKYIVFKDGDFLQHNFANIKKDIKYE